MMNRLGAVLLVIAACKGGDDKSKSGGGASSKGGCETTAKKPAELVTGKTPQMLAPLSGLKLGMSPAEAAKVCPNFFEGEDGKKTGTFSVGEIVGKFGETYAQGRLDFSSDKLETIELSLPAEIADALTAAWGAPKVSSGKAPAHAWIDEAAGVRAILEPPESDGRRELAVSAFTPLVAFVEPETTTIAWKPQDILGKKPADLAKQLAQYVKVEKTSAAVKAKTDELMADLNKEVEALGVDTKRNENDPKFELPATPFGTGPTQVIVHTNDDGSVRSYGVWFRSASTFPEYGWPTQSADLIKLFDEKWGPSKKIKETLGERTTWFDAARGLRASTQIDKPEDLDVAYVRYLPLAKFFGAPGALWGFEKAERPLIGATPEEIVAAYGKDFEIKRDDKAGTLTMSLPPTDYEGDTAHTTILMFVRAGKVGDWRTHIPFEDYEPAKAEYEALLEAKLGKPKAAPRDHFLYGKSPTVDVQYSKYTHELDIEVTK
jgi:hypothetical protein